ncbi:MAG: hypothetical protein IH599_10390 [Bacteroidales bacterium]|nr:hypothetical protein [Bacteroidales bacterium]
MKTLAFTLTLVITGLLAKAQSDTIFLHTGDTLVCEILEISRKLNVQCIVREQEGGTWQGKIYEREIRSLVTHKDLLAMSDEISPGALVRKSGAHLYTAGTLSLFSTLSMVVGASLGNSNIDERIPFVLIVGGGAMGIGSMIFQISSGTRLRRAGVLLDRVDVGISPGGAAVRYTF